MNDLAGRKHRKGKRVRNERVSLLQPTGANHVWSPDFVMYSLAIGRRIKCLQIVDDFSRERVDIAADHGIGGEYVVRLSRRHGSAAGPARLMVRIAGSPAMRSINWRSTSLPTLDFATDDLYIYGGQVRRDSVCPSLYSDVEPWPIN